MARVKNINGIPIANIKNDTGVGSTHIKTAQDLQYRVAVYGYAAGGVAAANTANTNRMTFSTEAFAYNASSNLSQARAAIDVGLTDTVNYGYVIGGYTTAYVVTADRITLSTSATSANSASNLSEAGGYNGALSNGATYGYYFNGNTATNPAIEKTALRMTWSTGALAANAASDMSVARWLMTGLSAVLYGYISGGRTDSADNNLTAVTDELTWSTSVTAARTEANLSSTRRSTGAISDTVLYGYFMGGRENGGATPTANADRLTFSTRATAANSSSNLSAAKQGSFTMGNGVAYGYIAGGFTSTQVATTDRILFSTGVTSAYSTSDLPTATRNGGFLSDYCA